MPYPALHLFLPISLNDLSTLKFFLLHDPWVLLSLTSHWKTTVQNCITPFCNIISPYSKITVLISVGNSPSVLPTWDISGYQLIKWSNNHAKINCKFLLTLLSVCSFPPGQSRSYTDRWAWVKLFATEKETGEIYNYFLLY